MSTDLQSHLLLALAWIGYYLIHSLLAANKVKHLIHQYIGKLYTYYRIFYNAVAVLGLVALWIYQTNISKIILFDSSTVKVSGGILILIGLIWSREAFKNYDFKEFMGVTTPKGQNQNQHGQSLQTQGLNRYVRHPLYFGILVCLTGYVLWYQTLDSMIVYGVSTTYLWIGSIWEEQKLQQCYGESYQTYRKRVKRLIPYIL